MLFDVTISIIMLAVLGLLILYIRPKLKKAEQETPTPDRTKVLQIIVGIVTAIATWFVAVIMSFAHIMQTVAGTYNLPADGTAISGRDNITLDDSLMENTYRFLSGIICSRVPFRGDVHPPVC